MSPEPIAIDRGPAVPESVQVSVVIPAYRPAWLDEALDSVRAQGVEGVEIVLVDDGSPTPLAPPQTADLVLVRQPNGGAAAARNTGVQVARAPWIAFLDSDDRWAPEKLARQLAFHAAHPELIASTTDHVVLRGAERVPVDRRRRYRLRPPIIPFATLFHENCLATSSLLLRRDDYLAVGGMPTDLRFAEDYACWLRIGLRGPLGYLPEPLIEYREHDAGLTAQTAADTTHYTTELAIYESLLTDHPELRDAPYVAPALARCWRDLAWHEQAAGHTREARAAWREALRLAPTHPAAWRGLARSLFAR